MGLSELTIGILIGIIGSWLAADLCSALNKLAMHLTRRAAARLPGHLRERYEEEWLANLDEWNRTTVQLLQAVGYFRAASLFVHNWRKGKSKPEHLDKAYLALIEGRIYYYLRPCLIVTNFFYRYLPFLNAPLCRIISRINGYFCLPDVTMTVSLLVFGMPDDRDRVLNPRTRVLQIVKAMKRT